MTFYIKLKCLNNTGRNIKKIKINNCHVDGRTEDDIVSQTFLKEGKKANLKVTK